MSSSAEFWRSFAHDPRDPSTASLRASDADRNVVHGVLVEAFADGRLNRPEYDERSAAVLAARTLGELPGLVADLVPDRTLVPDGRVPLEVASQGDLQDRALESWRGDLRAAFAGIVGSAVVTWAVWAFFTFGGFPWPLIINAFALLNFLRIAANRRQLVAEEVQRLERKRLKKLKAQERQRALPAPAKPDEGR